MPTGTPSKHYPYVLVPEDHPAFRNKKAAIRNAKKIGRRKNRLNASAISSQRSSLLSSQITE
jgi:hypothetical protein